MKIKNISGEARKVRHAGKVAQRVSTVEVANAVGADVLGEQQERRGGPLAMFALKQELAERLRSTGGRRSLEGTTRRQKIPLGELDWLVLEYLAGQLRDDDQRPTAGQVASALLRRALWNVQQLRWLAEHVAPRLREQPLVLWLFAEALRVGRYFADEAEARRNLLADAHAQADAGEISGELVRRLEQAEADLPSAYAQAMQAVQMPHAGSVRPPPHQ